MLSKWQPWDFIRNHPHVIGQETGFSGFLCQDPFMERILLNRLKKRGYSFPIYTGSEISADWLESNLKVLDLFASEKSFIILQAEKIPAPAKRKLFEDNWDVSGHCLFFFSSQNSLFEEFSKSISGKFFKIEEPRFWEGKKLLNFLSEELSLGLPYDVQNYLLGCIPNTVRDLATALNLIELYFPSGKGANLNEVKEIVSPAKLDQFEFARLFGQRKKSQFFLRLLSMELDFDSFRGLFAFMQGHLFRLADPGYLEKKPRLSNYDKEILAHSKLWQEGELEKEMRTFGRLEIEAKKRSSDLQNFMRLEYLSQY